MNPNSNKVSVWIDLEETLIKSWFDHFLTPEFPKVKKFVESLPVNRVNIFSYAIWGDEDETTFEETLQGWLEDQLEYVIEKCPSVNKMITSTRHFQGIIYVDVNDYINLVPKWLGFYYYISNLQSYNTTYYLIDDAVPNMTINVKESGNIFKFINVKDL